MIDHTTYLSSGGLATRDQWICAFNRVSFAAESKLHPLGFAGWVFATHRARLKERVVVSLILAVDAPSVNGNSEKRFSYATTQDLFGDVPPR